MSRVVTPGEDEPQSETDPGRTPLGTIKDTTPRKSSQKKHVSSDIENLLPKLPLSRVPQDVPDPRNRKSHPRRLSIKKGNSIPALVNDLNDLTVINRYLKIASENMTANFGEDWKNQSNLKSYKKWKKATVWTEKAGDSAELTFASLVEGLSKYLGEPVYAIQGDRIIIKKGSG